MTSESKPAKDDRVFSYRTFRFLIGFIAISIAIVTWALSGEAIGSISASYHTDAQDIFVGSLFIVSIFMLAYNGKRIDGKRNWWEFTFAKAASLFAVLVALFPTDSNCSAVECFPEYARELSNLIGTTPPGVHGFSAVAFFILLFLIMCIFLHRAWYKEKGPCRAIVYGICAIGMIGAVFYVLLQDSRRDVFWGEFLALFFFGLGWIYSGLYEYLSPKRWWPKCPNSFLKWHTLWLAARKAEI